ncbi:MAG TPA: ABC transporter permease subunit [Phycisphaerae bacterium]|nr:ABC transporter permease subunit [Phycisphaerae bacterium]
MRNLIWKEFRQNSRVLLAVAIVAFAPYAMVVSFKLTCESNPAPAGRLIDAIAKASSFSLLLSCLLAAFLGGNAMAGERADRSAEFAAGLPIPRRPAIASKLAVSLGACLALFLVNYAVLALLLPLAEPNLTAASNFIRSMALVFLVMVGTFGIAWFFSSLLRSPAIAAAAAIGTATMLVMIVRQAYGWEVPENTARLSLGDSIALSILALGVVLLVAGTGIALRRKEP